jgi:hypothetical protein
MRPSVRSNLNENHMLGLEGRHDPIVLPKVGYDILSYEIQTILRDL